MVDRVFAELLECNSINLNLLSDGFLLFFGKLNAADPSGLSDHRWRNLCTSLSNLRECAMKDGRTKSSTSQDGQNGATSQHVTSSRGECGDENGAKFILLCSDFCCRAMRNRPKFYS